MKIKIQNKAGVAFTLICQIIFLLALSENIVSIPDEKAPIKDFNNPKVLTENDIKYIKTIDQINIVVEKRPDLIHKLSSVQLGMAKREFVENVPYQYAESYFYAKMTGDLITPENYNEFILYKKVFSEQKKIVLDDSLFSPSMKLEMNSENIKITSPKCQISLEQIAYYNLKYANQEIKIASSDLGINIKPPNFEEVTLLKGKAIFNKDYILFSEGSSFSFGNTKIIETSGIGLYLSKLEIVPGSYYQPTDFILKDKDRLIITVGGSKKLKIETKDGEYESINVNSLGESFTGGENPKKGKVELIIKDENKNQKADLIFESSITSIPPVPKLKTKIAGMFEDKNKERHKWILENGKLSIDEKYQRGSLSPIEYNRLVTDIAFGNNAGDIQKRIDEISSKIVYSKTLTDEDKHFIENMYNIIITGSIFYYGSAEPAKAMKHYLDGQGTPLEFDSKIFRGDDSVIPAIEEIKIKIKGGLETNEKAKTSKLISSYDYHGQSPLGHTFGSFFLKADAQQLADGQVEITWRVDDYYDFENKGEITVIPVGRLSLQNNKGGVLKLPDLISSSLPSLGMAKEYNMFSTWKTRCDKDMKKCTQVK